MTLPLATADDHQCTTGAHWEPPVSALFSVTLTPAVPAYLALHRSDDTEANRLTT